MRMPVDEVYAWGNALMMTDQEMIASLRPAGSSSTPRVEVEGGGLEALRKLHARSTAAQQTGPLAERRRAAHTAREDNAEA